MDERVQGRVRLRSPPWRRIMVIGAVALLLVGWFAPRAVPAPADDWKLPMADRAERVVRGVADHRLGDTTVAERTRSAADIVEAPITWLTHVLSTGFPDPDPRILEPRIPAAPWVVITGVFAVLGLALGGWRLAAGVVLGCVFLAAFGLWVDAMQTFATVLMAMLTSLFVGLVTGIVASTRPRLHRALESLMNVLQTVPVFSYLVPTILFFGYGPVAALIATAIYAIPPLYHAVVLGLHSVPSELEEAGRMAGCSSGQLLRKVRLPAALPPVAVGINQAIMMSLNMVIIASMIGAGGLGYRVLTALRRLDVGAAFEAGLGIVAWAIILDRLTQRFAHSLAQGRRPVPVGFPLVRALVGVIVVGLLAARLVPALQEWPSVNALTTARFWNDLISWINTNLFGVLDAVRNFSVLHVMNPLKRWLVELPWPSVVAAIALVGAAVGGWRLAVRCAVLGTFMAASGFWLQSMVSVYLVVLGVFFSVLIGAPIGLLVGRSPRLRAITNGVADVLQTLPSLVYLVPAVGLFKNGDFPALLAIVAYGVAPAVRYVSLGLAEVPSERLEVGRMVGASRRQQFVSISLPAALPSLLVGLNQVVMMSLSMLVVTALVGTSDLGQAVYTALTRARVGDALVAGLCVAAIAMIAAQLVKGVARRASARMETR